MENNKQKRKTLSAMQKLEVIEAMRDGATQEEVAQRFQISQSSISNIKKSHSSGILITMAPAAKRKRVATHEDLDKALLVWFTDARERSAPIDGNMLMSKIEILAKIYNIDPIPSRGWLQSWGKRNGISFGKQHGEAASADTPAAYDFLRIQIPAILSKYLVSDCYNCDEMGLFYKCLPKFTFEFSKNKEAVRGIKQDETRFTALVCCNADGSDKVRLTIIGKYAKPHPLKGCMHALPVNYRYNTKA